MMNRAVSAALLSALVFPGVGQLYLKRRRRGWLFVLVALVAVVVFMAPILDLVLRISDEVAAGTLPYDPIAIAMRLEDQRRPASALQSLAPLVMVASWIASTVDAWLLGRKTG
jgi:TM2 domain-containing membrane protein YozV